MSFFCCLNTQTCNVNVDFYHGIACWVTLAHFDMQSCFGGLGFFSSMVKEHLRGWLWNHFRCRQYQSQPSRLDVMSYSPHHIGDGHMSETKIFSHFHKRLGLTAVWLCSQDLGGLIHFWLRSSGLFWKLYSPLPHSPTSPHHTVCHLQTCFSKRAFFIHFYKYTTFAHRWSSIVSDTENKLTSQLQSENINGSSVELGKYPWEPGK